MKDYKNLFLRKKSNRPGATLDSARVEKGEVIQDTQKLPPSICRELLLGPPVRIRGPTLKA